MGPLQVFQISSWNKPSRKIPKGMILSLGLHNTFRSVLMSSMMIWTLGWYKASDANIIERSRYFIERLSWVLRGEVIRWNSEFKNQRTHVLVQADALNWRMSSPAIASGKEKMRNLSDEAAHRMTENNHFNASCFSTRWESNSSMNYELMTLSLKYYVQF